MKIVIGISRIPSLLLENLTGFSKHFFIPQFLCSKLRVCKSPKVFSHAEDTKKSEGGLQNTVSPPAGLGQSLGGGPRGEAQGSSAYLTFENLLL